MRNDFSTGVIPGSVTICNTKSRKIENHFMEKNPTITEYHSLIPC